MKYFFIVILILGLSCCKNSPGISDFVDSTEYQNNPYIISNTRVGKIERGNSIHDLDTLFPSSLVKINKIHTGYFNEEVDEYKVYNTEGQLQLTISPRVPKDTNEYINRIIIRDSLYQTAKGLGVNSTLGELRKNYLSLNYSQTSGDLLVSIRDIDASFLFNKQQLDDSWWDDEKNHLIGRLIPDSIRVDAVIVYWNTEKPKQELPAIFTPPFWYDKLTKLAVWTIQELPSIVILILFFIVLLRFTKFTVNKMKKLAAQRADREDNPLESQKRITTLSGIIYSVVRIFLWVIFLLILLGKFNINIAPLLASAGIIGLAVGFGAQELVRDFISGFFILLEDQLRTGDYAVINGTEGNVEKVELRTITLRDGSGTVHIFQNGKINSLSNKTKEWSAIVLDIGVAYKEDTDHVSALMKQVGDEMYKDPVYSKIMIEPITISGVNAFGDSAVVIRAVIKTQPKQQWDAGREYRRRIKKEFDAQNVEFPFNYTTLTWGDSSNPIRLSVDKNP